MSAAHRDAAAFHDLPQDEVRQIAVEAYLYAYPLVLMEVTRRVMTNVAAPKPNGHAPVNAFGHMRAFPDATFTDVVKANADTLYSTLWFDVGEEPLIVELPDAGARYYLLQHMDMWSDVFAAPGTRTTGNAALRYALIGPNWRGAPLRGIPEIRSPTARGWIVGRTQTNGTADYSAVHAFQDAMRATPLGRFGKEAQPSQAATNTALDMSAPVEQVAKMEAATFFAFFAELLRQYAPHGNDYPALARFARLGLVPGKPFDGSLLTPVRKAAFDAAPAAAMRRIEETVLKDGGHANGWTFFTAPIGTYGTDYRRRAAIAFAGLGANVLEDAFYPMMNAGPGGKKLDSATRYVLHFAPGRTPPARAFWSVTLYNDKQFFAANPLGRYAIGDRDTLALNPDGSLDIFVQRDRPARESNWLPAPASGGFTLAMRIYWPKPEALDGSWSPPPLVPQ